VVRATGEDGVPVEIRQQIQLYTTNDLLIHPLISPTLAYLGGLPPLFVIASDREVLRDEIVYTLVSSPVTWTFILMGCLMFARAHRAANPEKYPVSDEVKKLYPAYEGIESRMKPTMVHLQVYDGRHSSRSPPSFFFCSNLALLDAAHVLPMMFIATTPAKYCYRAIATFIKHVTNMPPTAALQKHKPPPPQTSDLTPGETVATPVALSPVEEDERPTAAAQPSSPTRPTRFSRVTSSLRRGSSLFSRFSRGTSGVSHVEDECAAGHADVLAGDPVVYHGGWVSCLAPLLPPLSQNDTYRRRQNLQSTTAAVS
jgi:hypothetical protein